MGGLCNEKLDLGYLGPSSTFVHFTFLKGVRCHVSCLH